MATLRWRGGAAAVAEVHTYAFAGTWEATDLIRVVIGSKQVDFVAGSTVTNTVVSNLVTAWNALDASDYPELAEVTASVVTAGTLTLTHDTPGWPFVATLTPLEAGGGAADAQTIEGAGTATTGTVATAATGPHHWDDPLNWSTGAVPTTGDTAYLENSEDDILFGLAQSGVTLAQLVVSNSFSGRLGLPMVNEEGDETYPEYRPRSLVIGATSCIVGEGVGPGSGRLRLNMSSIQTALTVYGTGGPDEDGLEALCWVGTHAANVVSVFAGSVAIAPHGTDTATVATLRVGQQGGGDSDVSMRVGDGAALTTLEQLAGEVRLDGATVTTVAKVGGRLSLLDCGTVTTLTNDAGEVVYRSAGTITTLTIGPRGVVDFSQDMRGRTVTNAAQLHPGAALLDPYATVTFSAGIKLNRGEVADFVLSLGYHRTLTPS